MGRDKGIVQRNKDSGRKAVVHEALALPAKGGELAVFGMVGRGREVVIDTKITMKGRGGHGIIGVIELSGDGGRRDRLRGVNPGSVGEGGEGGGRGRVVNTNATFVGADTKFVYDRHIARELEVMADEEGECGGGSGGEISASIIAVGVCGEMLGRSNVTVVRGRMRGSIAMGGGGRRGR